MPPSWEIAVLIPARNEERLLARCLYSVMAAIDALPVTIHASIMLVSDCSTDRTADVACRNIRERGSVLHTAAGAVGTARALAASFAIENSLVPPSRLWLANTDADCMVPLTWLSDQITLASRGIEAVAGIVRVDSFAEHAPEVPVRFRSTYLTYADGTHPHVHGANLGVKADSYMDSGGWADLKTAEDHDLWRRLKRTGARVLSSALLHVVTSGRRIGRAPDGFADALAAHNEPVLIG